MLRVPCVIDDLAVHYPNNYYSSTGTGRTTQMVVAVLVVAVAIFLGYIGAKYWNNNIVKAIPQKPTREEETKADVPRLCKWTV